MKLVDFGDTMVKFLLDRERDQKVQITKISKQNKQTKRSGDESEQQNRKRWNNNQHLNIYHLLGFISKKSIKTVAQYTLCL